MAVSLLLLLASLAAQTPAPQAPQPPAKKVTRKKHAAKPAPAPEPEPQPPPAPLTPEQMPAAAPQVSYNDGLLSIVAANSTLADVLHAVSARTGATVDAPPNLTSERVAVHIGPGTPRDVLTELLSGSHFDYILVGADGDPNAVRSVILTPNQQSPAATAVAQVQPTRTVSSADDDSDDDAEEPPVQPPPQPGPPRHRPFIQQQTPPDQVVAQPATPDAAPDQSQTPPTKTPEQLLDELRKMQQNPSQQQQQQQNNQQH